MQDSNQHHELNAYVGTIVGESTSREFRLAVAHEAIREQDIIAVDAQLRSTTPGVLPEQLRIWAKVQRIERMNPLFPSEAGHELAATRTDPFDTVLSLSREMVTAVCQVLGAERFGTDAVGRLDQLRYPPQPATRAYRPASEDLVRVLLGDLGKNDRRALDIAVLANRPEVDVKVDGHAVVTRHLAILAMTGAGKSWAARRIVEELAKRQYPIVIFDPHGDYTGLADVKGLGNRVRRYYAQLPLFEEDADTVARIVSDLGYGLSDTMRFRFPDVFEAARSFFDCNDTELAKRIASLGELAGNSVHTYGVQPNMWLIANMASAGRFAVLDGKTSLVTWDWPELARYNRRDAATLEAIEKRSRSAASVLHRMERINRSIARAADPLPIDRRQIVGDGSISIISLAGYTSDFQATIYSIIADDLFEARVQDPDSWPVLLVLEEAHNFAPAQSRTPAESRAITTTRQIAQEGRKFNVGLILISQRPSRLDETTLSQCNSYVIMRMVNPADQNFVRRVVESLGEDDARMLPDLDVGEAILSGQLVKFPTLVRLKEPESAGEREERDAFAVLDEVRRNNPSSASAR